MTARTKELFLDWHGLWPGATGYDKDGSAFISEAPSGVKLSVQPATVTEPVLGPLRRALPSMGGLDFSPMVLLIGLQMLKSLF